MGNNKTNMKIKESIAYTLKQMGYDIFDLRKEGAGFYIAKQCVNHGEDLLVYEKGKFIAAPNPDSQKKHGPRRDVTKVARALNGVFALGAREDRPGLLEEEIKPYKKLTVKLSDPLLKPGHIPTHSAFLKIEYFVNQNQEWFSIRELIKALSISSKWMVRFLKNHFAHYGDEEFAIERTAVCSGRMPDGTIVYRQPFKNGDKVVLARTEFNEITGVECHWLNRLNERVYKRNAEQGEQLILPDKEYTVITTGGHNVKLAENDHYYLNAFHFDIQS
jgi:hypothetical protein